MAKTNDQDRRRGAQSPAAERKTKSAAAAARRARLADALRDNLQKRKDQARARRGAKAVDEPES